MAAVTTVDQIRSPLAVRMLNCCGALLDGAVIREARPANFLEAAKRRSRLQDFGDGNFIEALARLLESCNRDAQLNLIGKMALRSDVTRLLCNRLRLERERKMCADIEREKIRQPLFITGLPRTGTTLLHTLLAADPAHRAPLTWEVMEPATRGRAANRSLAQRRAKRNLGWLEWLAPHFGRVHATGAELPQECVSLMSPSFLSDQFDTMYNVPRYRAWFLRQDLSPAYHFHRRFLQHLQHGHPAQRWILKAPAHMFALPTLLAFYPDAIFVQTHRAPLQAVASVSSLITILRRVFSDAVDPHEIGREALRYWSETVERFMRERDQLPDARVCDLLYQDLQRHPLAAIAEIYQHFGWTLSAEAERRMRHVLKKQARELRSYHRYHLAQFGFSIAQEREFFAAYCERFDLFTREERASFRSAAPGAREFASSPLA